MHSVQALVAANANNMIETVEPLLAALPVVILDHSQKFSANQPKRRSPTPSPYQTRTRPRDSGFSLLTPTAVPEAISELLNIHLLTLLAAAVNQSAQQSAQNNNSWRG
jgi:hypothetical protein